MFTTFAIPIRMMCNEASYIANEEEKLILIVLCPKKIKKYKFNEAFSSNFKVGS